VKSLIITRRKQIRNFLKDALEWELKHMESFCPSREHKKDLSLKNGHGTCQAKWIDEGLNKEYHPKTSLAKIPNLWHTFEG
jgi:hypothetical protein